MPEEDEPHRPPKYVDGQLDSASKREELLIRLVADLGKQSMNDTEQVFDDLRRLNTKYGDDA